MFNKFIRVYNDQAVRDAASVVSRAIENHDETLKSIADAEVKSKDRVDIPLAEYERLKEENKMLRHENRSLKLTLDRIGVPHELMARIIPSSVKCERCNDILDFKALYRVYFEVEDYPSCRI